MTAIIFAGVVLFGADRLLLWMESRGHINWRRKGRKRLSEEPTAGLDSMLSDSSHR
ncbi:hypothetical protein [Nonomuraea africana]|uniref:Uncharacterized protein n=1 Tax=Nonomuraea africana TaxID=46171 RepID=A0ABR9K7S8_9ACTN|nr:hypothetical protein [Nonomuraea africana]MBE1557861.1 hypothetical protein [Nonomuraea africana]